MVRRYKIRGLHHQLSAGCSPREEWLPYGRCRLLLSAASTDDVANFLELLYATQTFGFALYEELFLLSGADISEGFTLADVSTLSSYLSEAAGEVRDDGLEVACGRLDVAERLTRLDEGTEGRSRRVVFGIDLPDDLTGGRSFDRLGALALDLHCIFGAVALF